MQNQCRHWLETPFRKIKVANSGYTIIPGSWFMVRDKRPTQTLKVGRWRLMKINRGAVATEDGKRALVRGVNAADGEAGEVPAAVE